MKPSLLLRIASIITLLIAAGHSSGGLGFWSPAGETDVLRAMRSFHFDAAGVSILGLRSMLQGNTKTPNPSDMDSERRRAHGSPDSKQFDDHQEHRAHLK